MSLLPALDHNEESLVITQAVGHWLYVHYKRHPLYFSA
jgi:hypothetical protein